MIWSTRRRDARLACLALVIAVQRGVNGICHFRTSINCERNGFVRATTGANHESGETIAFGQSRQIPAFSSTTRLRRIVSEHNRKDTLGQNGINGQAQAVNYSKPFRDSDAVQTLHRVLDETSQDEPKRDDDAMLEEEDSRHDEDVVSDDEAATADGDDSLELRAENEEETEILSAEDDDEDSSESPSRNEPADDGSDKEKSKDGREKDERAGKEEPPSESDQVETSDHTDENSSHEDSGDNRDEKPKKSKRDQEEVSNRGDPDEETEETRDVNNDEEMELESGSNADEEETEVPVGDGHDDENLNENEPKEGQMKDLNVLNDDSASNVVDDNDGGHTRTEDGVDHDAELNPGDEQSQEFDDIVDDPNTVDDGSDKDDTEFDQSGSDEDGNSVDDNPPPDDGTGTDDQGNVGVGIDDTDENDDMDNNSAGSVDDTPTDDGNVTDSPETDSPTEAPNVFMSDDRNQSEDDDSGSTNDQVGSETGDETDNDINSGNPDDGGEEDGNKGGNDSDESTSDNDSGANDNGNENDSSEGNSETSGGNQNPMPRPANPRPSPLPPTQLDPKPSPLPPTPLDPEPTPTQPDPPRPETQPVQFVPFPTTRPPTDENPSNENETSLEEPPNNPTARPTGQPDIAVALTGGPLEATNTPESAGDETEASFSPISQPNLSPTAPLLTAEPTPKEGLIQIFASGSPTVSAMPSASPTVTMSPSGLRNPTATPTTQLLIPIPQFRFVEWSILTPETRMLADRLSYTSETWNVPGTASIESMSFSRIESTAPDSIDYITALGFARPSWDCYMNHYRNYSWEELESVGVQQYYVLLGWTAVSWIDVTPPLVESQRWEGLTRDEKVAAESVCYLEPIWNRDNLENAAAWGWGDRSSPEASSAVSTFIMSAMLLLAGVFLID